MISQFDDHFNKLLKNINSNNKFILGLSGGIDSMALLHLIKNFTDENKTQKRINVKNEALKTDFLICWPRKSIENKATKSKITENKFL